jgi:hypothetical protein
MNVSMNCSNLAAGCWWGTVTRDKNAHILLQISTQTNQAASAAVGGSEVKKERKLNFDESFG